MAQGHGAIPSNSEATFMSETPTPTAPTQEQPTPAPTPAANPAAPATTPPADERKADPEDNWRDRFEGQQKVTRDLESKLNALRDGLRSALGVEDKKGDGGDLVTTLQQQISQIQHEGLVDRMARRHGITDDADVEFLRTAHDETAMTRLAERLKGTTPIPPSSPAPDPSQASAPLSQEAAENAGYEAFFPTR